MDMQSIFMQIGNALTTVILRSPLHGAISKSTLLLAITGHKSGHEITLPINYFQYGDTLYITSPRSRKWWRNLRGGAPVLVRLEGREVDGTAMVVEEPAAALEN